jgi:magnesium transporter
VALTAYRDDAGSFHTSTTRELPDEIIWVDLLSPTDEEKRLVESRTGVRIPSAADLSEIEASSRPTPTRRTPSSHRPASSSPSVSW